MANVLLRIDGAVTTPRDLTFADLETLDACHRILDVSQFDPKRKGDAIKLSGLLDLVGLLPTAQYIGLHGSRDNFHASIPLAPVRDRAFLIYRLAGQPLDLQAGGPVRFYIPDHAACHTAEIDECANVKFVDHIELTATKGFDNRPQDESEHQRLHQHQAK
jgi:DMSO/TMAO reductase YedYZ molybdopterin-dependent catalytic subunit